MGLLDGIDGGLNLADADAPSFDALRAGWYPCAVTDLSRGESGPEAKKYPNCPMIEVEWTVQEGPGENRRFWRNYLLHPDFSGFLKGLFMGLGFSEEEVDEPGFDPDYEEILGTLCDVKVNRKKAKSGPREGDYENNVQQVAPHGSKASAYVKDSKPAAGGSDGGSLLP